MKRIVTLTLNDIYEFSGHYYLRAEFIPRALASALEVRRDMAGITVDGEVFLYQGDYNRQSQQQRWMTYVDTATIAFSKKLAKEAYDIVITPERRIIEEGELVGALIKQLKASGPKGYVDEFNVPGFVLKKPKSEEE